MSVINSLYTNPTVGNTIEFDNTGSGLASTDINNAITELASLNRMYSYPAMLNVSKWEGQTSPFLYKLESEYIVDKCNIILSMGEDATDKQVEECANSAIEIKSQGIGYIVLLAHGDKPSINIPVELNIGRLISVPDGRNGDYITFNNTTNQNWVTASTVNEALNQILERVSTVIKSSSADSIEFDDSKLQLGISNIQEALEEILSRGALSGITRNRTEYTLDANNWIGVNPPYLYNIEDDNITNDSDIEIGTVYNMTTDQYIALTKACIVSGGTFSKKIVIKAFGEKPTLNIPISIINYNGR